MNIIEENANAYKNNIKSNKIVKFNVWENNHITPKEYYIIK